MPWSLEALFQGGEWLASVTCKRGRRWALPGSDCTGLSGREAPPGASRSSMILLCCLNTPCPLPFTAPALSWDMCQLQSWFTPACTPSPGEVQLQPRLTQPQQSTGTSQDAQHDSPLKRAFLLLPTAVHCCCLREGAGALPEKAGMHSPADQRGYTPAQQREQDVRMLKPGFCHLQQQCPRAWLDYTACDQISCSSAVPLQIATKHSAPAEIWN